MVKTYEHLTQEDVDFFLENGYLVVKNAFSREKAEVFTKDMWVRLGLDPHDPTTWDRERVHMPYHTREPVATFAPKVWEIMKELLGGEDRIDASASQWGDSFIVNFGPPPSPSQPTIAPQELDNWHVDGDFFVHFLDSPEQALLVIPLFSDILPGGGGTYIAPEGIDLVARYLAAHPEGVLPSHLSFVPNTAPAPAPDSDSVPNPSHDTAPLRNSEMFSHLAAAKQCTTFVELTGSTGDVILLHPLMLHSASPNRLRVPRVITNPPVALTQPFRFARSGGSSGWGSGGEGGEGEEEGEGEYSLVERKTLKALAVDRLEFCARGERRRLVPARVGREAGMREEERRRVEEARARAKDVLAMPQAQTQVPEATPIAVAVA